MAGRRIVPARVLPVRIVADIVSDVRATEVAVTGKVGAMCAREVGSVVAQPEQHHQELKGQDGAADESGPAEDVVEHSKPPPTTPRARARCSNSHCNSTAGPVRLRQMCDCFNCRTLPPQAET